MMSNFKFVGRSSLKSIICKKKKIVDDNFIVCKYCLCHESFDFFIPYTSQYYISEVPKCCIGWSDFHHFLLITKYIATTISYVKNYDR